MPCFVGARLALVLAGLPLPPPGYAFLADRDGACLLDRDGAYLMEPL